MWYASASCTCSRLLGLQHPAMVDDPEFDIDYHVRRASIPAPGGPAELADLVADVASRPLDRSRPLWEFHVVEGLEHGYWPWSPKCTTRSSMACPEPR